MGRTWTRLDNGGPGKLEGAWLMGGRYRNGNKQMRSIDGPRKTMKLLSGKRFQWIAYNTSFFIVWFEPPNVPPIAILIMIKKSQLKGKEQAFPTI